MRKFMRHFQYQHSRASDPIALPRTESTRLTRPHLVPVVTDTESELQLPPVFFQPQSSSSSGSDAVSPRDDTLSAQLPEYSDRECPWPLIIVMTGNATKTDRDRCLALGAWAFLPKPVDIETLYRVLARANVMVAEE